MIEGRVVSCSIGAVTPRHLGFQCLSWHSGCSCKVERSSRGVALDDEGDLKGRLRESWGAVSFKHNFWVLAVRKLATFLLQKGVLLWF